jgi:hypothetical protein
MRWFAREHHFPDTDGEVELVVYRVTKRQSGARESAQTDQLARLLNQEMPEGFTQRKPWSKVHD